MTRLLLLALALATGAAACGGPSHPPAPLPPPPMPPAPAAPMTPHSTTPTEAPPLARLPSDVRPMHYTLALEVVPERQQFAGTVEIAAVLDRPRELIWLHGRGLTAKSASVRSEGSGPMPARYDVVDPSGVVALRLPRPVGPGKIFIRIDYEAPFGSRLEGAYRVTAANRSYVFTQLEPIFARRVFPCFDEPAFKTPFDVTLFVGRHNEAIANTHEIERTDAPGGLKRLVFATTAPLPTYLVAFAVGPLDIVVAPPVPPNAARRRPLPLRGVAAHGRGKEMGYALERTAEILAVLEGYTGLEYPYDKLDIVAVPDKGGAMENPGAVTFREWFVLLDPKTAPADQQRQFASVMAHELAHQWFGDFVTMPWWDDIWLNEAFATWAQGRIVRMWHPGQQPEATMLERVHEVMNLDGLTSARQIRQEVRDVNDIANAFDNITYIKGGSVIGMFEHWVGVEAFQRGLRSYLEKYRFGVATSNDLLASVSEAAQRDVATPFRTFLMQPGVPHLEAQLSCDKAPALLLKQSRYLPLGSSGDPNRVWQIPVCARYPSGTALKESCTLLTERQGTLPLEGGKCPAWALPNPDGAGYYRWSMPAPDTAKLTGAGWSKLGVRDRMTIGQSLRTGFARGTVPAADVFAALPPLASDPNRSVAILPIEFVQTARQWLQAGERGTAEAFGRRLYAQAYRELGWAPKKGKPEDPDRGLLRREVLTFLGLSSKDPGVLKEGAAIGRAYIGFGKDGAFHPELVDPNSVNAALAIAVADGDDAVFNAVVKKLSETDDEAVRSRLFTALAAARKPELAAQALALTLDPRVKVNETLVILDAMIKDVETQELAWQWLTKNVDALIARLPPGRAGHLPWYGTHFCDKAHAEELSRTFAPRVQRLDGGPRDLAEALEMVTLCIARRQAQLESLRSFFKKPQTKT